MIIRVVHQSHYTQVRNKTIRDSRLSLKARGLLVYLLSLPDESRVDRTELSRIGPDGERAIRNALGELKKAGYLSRELVRGDHGRLYTVTTVREQAEGATPLTAGALRPSGRRPSGGAPTHSLNEQGGGPARKQRATPPEYLCAACGARATRMAADATWWCDEHRAEYELHSLVPGS